MSYNPISNYGLIGDCRTAALVSKEGSIDWLCLPNFDSDTVFAAILDDQKGGRFQITGKAIKSTYREYREQTAIIDTIFDCEDGSFRLSDCMVTGTNKVLEPQRELLRRIEVLNGSPAIKIRFEARPGNAKRKAKMRQASPACWIFSEKGARFMLCSDVNLKCERYGLSGDVNGKAGDIFYLSFSYTERDMAVLPPLVEAEQRLQRTEQNWKEFGSTCTYQGLYRKQVLRSIITLKMLSSCLSGAVVAAPTTSLPEKIGGALNWDYRYCWLRDAAHTINAFASLGYLDEAYAYFSWMMHTTQLTRPRLQVLYDIFGRTKITEVENHTFEGYKASSPVRFGNAARDQTQMDIYGEVILSAYHLWRAGGVLEKGEQKTLRRFGDYICDHWQKKDHGIWEERGKPRHYTYSKVMCWAGLDKLQKLIENDVIIGDADRYKTIKNQIAQAVHTRSYNPDRNAYTAAFDEKLLDASLINLTRLGFAEPDEERNISTIRALQENLAVKGFFYRYEQQPGQPVDEGAFLMLSFWAVNQKLLSGEIEQATTQFESLLECANELGLYSEEIDPETRELLGNFPQAYTHTALINAAISLEKYKEGK